MKSSRGALAPSIYGVATGLILGFAAAFLASDGLAMSVVGPSDVDASIAAAGLSVVAAVLAAGLARLLLQVEARRLAVRSAVASLLALLVATVLHEIGRQWLDLSILGGGPWGDLVAILWPAALAVSLGAALGPIEPKDEVVPDETAPTDARSADRP